MFTMHAAIMTQESLRDFTWFTRWMQNSSRRLPTFGPSRWTHDCRRLSNCIHHRHLLLLSPPTDTLILHPAEDRRPSRPRWLATYPDGLPAREHHPSK